MELVSLIAFLVSAALMSPQAAQDPPQGYVTSKPLPTRSAPIQWTTNLALGEVAMAVYMKTPEGEGTWPGVVLLHDARGLSPETIRMADRLAAAGFVVIAPDLYEGKYALDADKGREMSVLMDAEQALARVEAVAAYLRQHKKVGDHRVGLVGFDLGGKLGVQAAMGSRDVSALAVAYARPATDVDSLRRIGCPVLGLFGAQDPLVPQADAEAFRAALAAAGRTAVVTIFDGAAHDFMKDGDPGYKADAATQAWSRLTAFLKENL